jgi:polyhydroxyalkanoate synthase
VRVACEITGEKQVNAVGYCIAGTTLTAVLALLKKRKEKPIKSATFFTTLTDFSEQGEFTVFLQDDFVDAIERQVEAEGMLDSYYMSKTFSFLRAKDLVYGPAVRSYMMGEAAAGLRPSLLERGLHEPAGQDGGAVSARPVPGQQLSEGTLELFGETLSVADVDVPVYAIACETDHIAAWKDSFRGVTQMGSRNKTFVLSESGHIAGIVNPPSKKKYGHYTNPEVSGTPEDWMAGRNTTKAPGGRAGRRGWRVGRASRFRPVSRVKAGYDVLASAPGTYVLEKTNG